MVTSFDKQPRNVVGDINVKMVFNREHLVNKCIVGEKFIEIVDINNNTLSQFIYKSLKKLVN